MPVLVQKFGGSSVSTRESRQTAIRRVLEARAQGYAVVVVVSAMGRRGAPYATDTLLDLISASGQLAERDVDLVLACGEIISAGVFLAELQQQCPAAMLTGPQAGILTDTVHGDARIVHVDPRRVKELLAAGQVVIVAGFQGVSPNGEITTLGRGGSDTSAVALGIALQASAVEIYTDVPGIMTADPKLVPEAQVLEAVDYQEMLQMAYEGAKVLHSRAVEMAMHNNLPLIVRSPEGKGPGTLITSASSYEARRSHPVVGVAHKVGLAQVGLQVDTKDPNLDCRLFAGLAEQKVSVDLINVSPKSKMFVVDAKHIGRVQDVLQRHSVTYEIRAGCCKVSVVGVGMRGVPGVMATLCRALHEAEVEILQTSDSHMTISCLIDEQQLGAAVRSLHRHFRLSKLG